MARIFISYKRVDKDKVFKIKDQIENAISEECWVDLDGIDYSSQFVSIICKAIDDAEIVLFMYSKAHTIIDFEDDWTIKELDYARRNKKRIILVKLDHTPLFGYFSFMFGSKNNCNSNDPVQFNKLLDEIKKRTTTEISKHNNNLNRKQNYILNGYETYTWLNGDKYTGNWCNNKREGHGTMYFKDGRKHVGSWKDDKRNGQGTMTWPNGAEYVGSWKDDMMHGMGVYYYNNSSNTISKYVGMQVEGKYCGHGTMYYKDGRKYVGSWKDDKENYGIIYANGHAIGAWVNGMKKTY